jgi:hypothetical protein
MQSVSFGVLSEDFSKCSRRLKRSEVRDDGSFEQPLWRSCCILRNPTPQGGSADKANSSNTKQHKPARFIREMPSQSSLGLKLHGLRFIFSFPLLRPQLLLE